MAEKKLKSDLYTVNATFLFDGDQYFVAGQTVQAGHPVLKGRESLFRPFTPDYPWPVGEAASEPAPEPTETATPASEPAATAEGE